MKVDEVMGLIFPCYNWELIILPILCQCRTLCTQFVIFEKKYVISFLCLLHSVLMQSDQHICYHF